MRTEPHDSFGRLPPSSWSKFARLAWILLGFLFLDFLFWSLADFGQFMPASSGAWQERAYWMALTALGPLAMTKIEALRTSGLMACGMIVVSVAAAIRWRHVGWIRGVAYSAIVAWWFLGLGAGAIRIT